MTGESFFFFIEVLTLVQFCWQPIEAAITPFFVVSSFHAMPVSLHCSLLSHFFMLSQCHCIVLCRVIFSCYAYVIALVFVISFFHAMPMSLHWKGNAGCFFFPVILCSLSTETILCSWCGVLLLFNITFMYSYCVHSLLLLHDFAGMAMMKTNKSGCIKAFNCLLCNICIIIFVTGWH